MAVFYKFFSHDDECVFFDPGAIYKEQDFNLLYHMISMDRKLANKSITIGDKIEYLERALKKCDVGRKMLKKSNMVPKARERHNKILDGLYTLINYYYPSKSVQEPAQVHPILQ